MYQSSSTGTYYTEEHGITFYSGFSNGTFTTVGNTWTTWHLIPSSRPSIASPKLITKYVEVPGMSGVIDLSEYLDSDSGRAKYGQCEGSWSFEVDNGHHTWRYNQESLITNLHGKRLYIKLQDDADYYEGRFTVGNYESGPDHSKITISYSIDPFKYRINSSTRTLDRYRFS